MRVFIKAHAIFYSVDGSAWGPIALSESEFKTCSNATLSEVVDVVLGDDYGAPIRQVTLVVDEQVDGSFKQSKKDLW